MWLTLEWPGKSCSRWMPLACGKLSLAFPTGRPIQNCLLGPQCVLTRFESPREEEREGQGCL